MGNKKIKLMIATPYFYPKTGGMEKHVFTICKGLVKNHNYKIIVVTSNHENDEFREETIEGIKIYRLPIQFKISNTPISLKWKKEIEKIADKEKPDLINGRGPVPFMADIASSVAKKKKIPFVLGWHFPSMKKGSLIIDFIISLYEEIFFKIMLKNSKRLICSSDFVKNTLLKDFKKKTTVITQGIDSSLFKKIKIKKEKQSIIFVGNLESDIKGLKYLLESISILKKNFPNIKLNVIGDGNTTFYKNKCKELGMEKNVCFKGKLVGKNLVKEYNRNQIFVCPSTAENFPSTLLEAMSCKLPIISSNIGNIPYFIKNNINGLLVPPRDSHALANSIIKVLKNKKLAEKISKRGYLSVKNSFNWKDRFNLTNKVFRGISKK